MTSTVTVLTCGHSARMAWASSRVSGLRLRSSAAHASDADADIEAEDEQRVGAVVVQIALDVAADAHQDGGDKDHGGDADHHAQHGQKRARLVLAHRLQRHLRIYAKVHLHKKSSGQWSVSAVRSCSVPVVATASRH